MNIIVGMFLIGIASVTPYVVLWVPLSILGGFMIGTGLFELF